MKPPRNPGKPQWQATTSSTATPRRPSMSARNVNRAGESVVVPWVGIVCGKTPSARNAVRRGIYSTCSATNLAISRQFSGGGCVLALCPVTARDRVAPVPAEGSATDPDAGGRLTTLVLVAFHQIENPPYRRPIEAACGNLIDRQILFNESLEDRIQNLVRRQAVSILLVGPELGGGRPIDDSRGDGT